MAEAWRTGVQTACRMQLTDCLKLRVGAMCCLYLQLARKGPYIRCAVQQHMRMGHSQTGHHGLQLCTGDAQAGEQGRRVGCGFWSEGAGCLLSCLGQGL